MRIDEEIQIPATPIAVLTRGGEFYQIGGLTDASIRKLGREMTKAMLATAKEQRQTRAKGKAK